MRKSLDFIYDAAGYLAAFFVFAIFAVMIISSGMREFGLRTGGTDDLVAWFCAAGSFLAMAHTFRRGDFVRVGLLLENLGARARHRFEILSLSVASGFVGFLAFWAARFVFESWKFNDMANGLIVVPLWIPQLSFVAGAALLLVAVLDELVTVVRGGKPGYVVAVEERHARGDFTEDV